MLAVKRLRSVPRKATVLGGILAPFAAFLVSIVLLWNSMVTWVDLAILIVMYTLTTLGLTAGFHRLLTHRAFETKPWIRNGFAVLGTMVAQNPVIVWVADHRQHHTHADEPGDPHTPHLDPNGSWRGTVRGLWHAHMGWLLRMDHEASPLRYARDLSSEPAMRWISMNFVPLVLLGIAIPFFLGLIATQSIWGGLTGLLWGGLVRIFLQHHVTFSVNSIGHYFGKRRFDTTDRSTNVAWLSLVSFGDSWHHNHHAFPTSARHGLTRLELDPTWWTICLLEKLNLAWNVVRFDATRIDSRLVQGAQSRSRRSSTT